ncbi:polyprenyl synthetase family protein [Bifidobacterium sp. ESL0745]|uniref:polyprenyl synthetase family protein n=1 Tax=Bifidobacterium sp. ESL0745 TaxID=2983226 RepID=UPI0023F8D796|nr:polyprenyl synthetase family protein [Bifidobacterium sp. ESL0745]MDF7664794.1 polyprenyl synthetase family protein [Bifidobacterium sp. ESL0745]
MQANVDNRVIDQRIAELTKTWMSDNLADVAENLRPTLNKVIDEGLTANRGGKRLRALLALAAYTSCKASKSYNNHDSAGIQTAAEDIPDAMLDLACAIEIYQTSALIHDDIIDDSPKRRGRPSAHVALAQEGTASNFGTGLALMLGNMLATASIDIAANALQSPALEYASANLHTFLDMQRAVEIGQSLDLAAETISLNKPDELITASLNVFEWKTASYTTITPLDLGFCAVGMPPDQARQSAKNIGLPLGIAFQLADDLLDVTGTNSGKPVGGDVREGKHTVLLADTLQAASVADRSALIDIYQKQARNDDDVHLALTLFESTGAIETSRRRIHDLWIQAESAINQAEMNQESRKTLTDACARFIPTDLR